MAERAIVVEHREHLWYLLAARGRSGPGLYLRLGYVQWRRPRWQHAVRRAVQACGVQLSRDRAVDAILLVSGDRDLTEAVRVAQGVGCKVVVAHPPNAGVAVALRQLVDARLQLASADLRKMLIPATAARSAW